MRRAILLSAILLLSDASIFAQKEYKSAYIKLSNREKSDV